MQDDPQRSLSPVEPASLSQIFTPLSGQPLVAPLWHTALIIALAATASIAGARGARHVHASTNLPTYIASIVMEWLLAAIVLWGIHLRRVPLRTVIGSSRPGLREWFVDAGSAFVFWIIALVVLSMVALALKPLHVNPEKIRSTVSQLAPYSTSELIAWTALCITAGICEEFIFRGYLQQQFARVSHRIWIGVLLSALLFGCSHGYEGWSGMVLITAFGALFSLLRLVRGNVRAGIMAHAWHDFVSGMVLSAIAHHKLPTLGA